MTSPQSEAPVVLSLQGVSKRFGTVQALQDVSMDCRAGEVHAVVGENGSGKSTLLGIASGYLAPDEGVVEIGGQRLHAARAGEALHLGLSMAYQNLAQVQRLSVAENLFLAAPVDERPHFRDMESWAADKLGQFGIAVSPAARTASLALGERQFLEVVKALLVKPRVLLLDEPTTALAPMEVERLHEIVSGLAAEGVGIVYVSHRLPEVLEIAHRATVLRDGEYQGTYTTSEMAEERLVALMIGRSLKLAFPPRLESVGEGEVMLEIEGLRGRRFGPLDLTLHRGEILGIAGAEGNGQAEILRGIAGIRRAAGTIRCNGRKVNLKSPYAALAAGIMMLSGDRTGEALFPVLGVRSNSSIQVLGRFSKGGWLRRGKEKATVEGIVERLKVRTPSIEQPVRFLSGGNQQKVLLTRPFLRDVHVILAEEPTQGVDVKSRFDMYEALRAKAAEGVAMIVKSSDPLELAGLCDRVIVVSRGQVIDEIEGSDLGEARIVEGIVGHRGARELLPRRPQRVGAAENEDAATEAKVPPKPTRQVQGWMPLAMMTCLMLAVGGYAAGRNADFYSSFNLNSLLGSSGTLPLALVAMGQVNALMVGGFDVSVGALMTLIVVVGSKGLLTIGGSWWSFALGSIALLAIGLAVGVLNAFLIRKIRLPSIIATLATLSVMQGIALVLRPVPDGEIDPEILDKLNASVSFVPYAFIGTLVLAAIWDFWLYRTTGGLAARAVGSDETSSRRMGLPSEAINWRAFVACSMMATLAGFFLIAQVGIGDARVGSGFALTSIAAAVLGGASLLGGKGSYVGAVVGALFLSLIINMLPLPNILPGFLLEWSDALPLICIGTFTLLALVVYQGPELWERLQAFRRDLRSGREPEPAPATIQR